LLMIAPTLAGGLTLRLQSRITSRSYIDMTLKLMNRFGIRYLWKNNEIRVDEQTYQPVNFTVEADWSAASYWYEALALCHSGKVELDGLHLSGLQGDEAVSRWFKWFGIKTSPTATGVKLVKVKDELPVHLFLKFDETPDMAQTMAVLCVAKGVSFHFTGLETLKIKETNRISALQNELAKLGAVLTEPQEGELSWDGTIRPEFIQQQPVIETYHDHRMALAFAPLALTGKGIRISDPMVVTKSYPGFWQELSGAGFDISVL